MSESMLSNFQTPSTCHTGAGAQVDFVQNSPNAGTDFPTPDFVLERGARDNGLLAGSSPSGR